METGRQKRLGPQVMIVKRSGVRMEYVPLGSA